LRAEVGQDRLVTLPAGRSGVIVGDVMGHGPEAAAVMAQLRAAAHALAQLDTNASWANPIEAQSGPVRTFVMGGSDHRNHPALARKLQACLRWRNAHARHPGVLAAQRRERARLRSERQQRWGRPKPKAASGLYS
jgi:hypothetical protein